MLIYIDRVIGKPPLGFYVTSSEEAKAYKATIVIGDIFAFAKNRQC
jgi:hypothetical protein